MHDHYCPECGKRMRKVAGDAHEFTSYLCPDHPLPAKPKPAPKKKAPAKKSGGAKMKKRQTRNPE